MLTAREQTRLRAQHWRDQTETLAAELRDELTSEQWAMVERYAAYGWMTAILDSTSAILVGRIRAEPG